MLEARWYPPSNSGAGAPATDVVAAPPAARPSSSRLAAAVPWLLLVASLAGGAVLWRLQPAPATRLVSRALIDFPQFAMSGASLGNFLTLSPDGTRLVHVGNPDGKNRLYVRRLDQFEATAIPGTDNASQPFFSPDGTAVGFFSGGKLKRVSLSGGAPLALEMMVVKAETTPALWFEELKAKVPRTR